MTPATTFAGRTVALFGLGGSGLATALALKSGGARVVACDDSAEAMAKAEGQGIETADLRTADWSRFAALILSPGVPLTHPEPPSPNSAAVRPAKVVAGVMLQPLANPRPHPEVRA